MAQIQLTDSVGRLIISNTAIPTGNTISNTTTETAFTEPQPIFSPAIWYPGRVFELDVAGVFGTAVVVPSIQGKIKLGSVVIGDTGSVTNVGSLTNKQWTGYIKMTCLTVGASGTIEVQGGIRMQTTTTEIVLPIVNTSVITLDMTTNQTLTLTATWSALSVSNTITLRQFILKG